MIFGNGGISSSIQVELSPKKSLFTGINHSFVVKRALLYFWEFEIASKTDSNTKCQILKHAVFTSIVSYTET
jgi:hypothetical protein